MHAPLGLDTYVAIVEAGSISEAARRLDEPRATLSRKLARLEEHLGVRLLHRSTRRMALTRAGDELYCRARRIVEETQAAERALRRLDDVPRGLLRVSIPAGPDSQTYGEMFAGFLLANPEVRVEILATNAHVDLVAQDIDVAIRAGRITDPNLIARTLMHSDFLAVASAEYLRAHGTPASPADLASHRCMTGFAGGDRPASSWPLRSGGSVRVTPWSSCNDPAILLGLVRRGLGIAMMPVSFVVDAIRAGELVAVLPHEVGSRLDVAAVYPEREFLDLKVRAFVDYLVAVFDAISIPGADECAGQGPEDRAGATSEAT